MDYFEYIIKYTILYFIVHLLYYFVISKSKHFKLRIIIKTTNACLEFRTFFNLTFVRMHQRKRRRRNLNFVNPSRDN